MIPLFFLLVGPFIVLSVLERLAPRVSTSRSTKGRLGVTFFLFATASAHFTDPATMSEMLPSWVPYRLEIILITGVFEVAGALGVWLPKLMKFTGLMIIIMLLCFLPSNIWAAWNSVDYGGNVNGPTYLWFRVPYQFFVVWWVYWATEQNWFGGRNRKAAEGASV